MRLSARLGLGLSFVLGCQKSSPPMTAPTAASPVVDARSAPNEWAAFSSAQLARDVKGDQSFAAKLYKAQRLPSTTNLFFSPASVRIAMGMAYAGARGTTATEISDVLELDPDRDVNARLFGQVLRDWNRAGSPLRVANRAWGQRDHKFMPDFLTTLSRDYQAPFGTVDFVGDTEGARRTINQWVDVTTEHKIRDLIQPGVLSASTALVLTNALYFKENWAAPFVRAQTFNSSFYSPSGEVRVPMMWKTDKVRFARITGAKVIKLGYASGERSMIVVLPERSDGLESWERSLDAATISRLTTLDKDSRVRLYLPRFSLRIASLLVPPLQSLGMRAPFDRGQEAADFSGMDGSRKLFISAIVHQAFVAVDEAGTEAAAATAEVMELKSERREPDVEEFHANHPFLFLICDKAGRVLFMGRVVDPTK